MADNKTVIGQDLADVLSQFLKLPEDQKNYSLGYLIAATGYTSTPEEANTLYSQFTTQLGKDELILSVMNYVSGEIMAEFHRKLHFHLSTLASANVEHEPELLNYLLHRYMKAKINGYKKILMGLLTLQQEFDSPWTLFSYEDKFEDVLHLEHPLSEEERKEILDIFFKGDNA